MIPRSCCKTRVWQRAKVRLRNRRSARTATQSRAVQRSRQLWTEAHARIDIQCGYRIAAAGARGRGNDNESHLNVYGLARTQREGVAWIPAIEDWNGEMGLGRPQICGQLAQSIRKIWRLGTASQRIECKTFPRRRGPAKSALQVRVNVSRQRCACGRPTGWMRVSAPAAGSASRPGKGPGKNVPYCGELLLVAKCVENDCILYPCCCCSSWLLNDSIAIESSSLTIPTAMSYGLYKWCFTGTVWLFRRRNKGPATK